MKKIYLLILFIPIIVLLIGIVYITIYFIFGKVVIKWKNFIL